MTQTKRTATLKIEFHPPPPPDGRPNFRPDGFHTYQIFNHEGRKRASGSVGPDKDRALSYVLDRAWDHGFTHYRTHDNPDVVLPVAA